MYQIHFKLISNWKYNSLPFDLFYKGIFSHMDRTFSNKTLPDLICYNIWTNLTFKMGGPNIIWSTVHQSFARYQTVDWYGLIFIGSINHVFLTSAMVDNNIEIRRKGIVQIVWFFFQSYNGDVSAKSFWVNRIRQFESTKQL